MTTLPARKRWLLQEPTWWAMTALVLACALLQLDATLREDTASPAFTVAGALMIVQLAVFGAVTALIARTRLQQATVESGAARRVRRLFFGSGAVLSFLAISWGATVVPAVAAYANTQHFAILTRLGLRSIAASIAAPLDEDLLRLAGTLGVLALCAKASGARGGLTPLDGLLYGFLVGAGFEIAENADAVLGAVGDDPLHAALHLALVRTSLGFGLHALWTGLTGAALSYCLARRRAGRGARWWLLALATLIPDAAARPLGRPRPLDRPELEARAPHRRLRHDTRALRRRLGLRLHLRLEKRQAASPKKRRRLDRAAAAISTRISQHHAARSAGGSKMTGSHVTPPRLATGRRRLLLPAALASTALLMTLIGCGMDRTDDSKPLPSEAEASTSASEECITDPDRIVHDPAPNQNAAFPDETQRRFEDAAAQAFADTGAPGTVVGISNDQGTWVRAFGTAEIDIATGAGLPGGTPMERGTHVRIGSITKTFTGTVAVQLDEEGLLSLDDSIEQYWPGIPGGDRITLRHLTSMTSGIPSYTLQESFQKDLFSNPTRSFTPAQLIAYALPDAPAFEPGERFDYSNTNTILLAAAIEQATGKPIDEVVAERILRPLGLAETSWPHDGMTLPSPYAEGITTQGLEDDGAGEAQDATHWNPSWAGAAGAIISTADDLLIYGQALATGQHLMLAESAEARLKSFPVGQTIGYGLGYACYNGWIGHEGSLPGYNTQLVYDTASHTTVVVTVNSDTRVGNCAAGKGRQRSGLADDRCLTPASRILLPLTELLGRPYTPSGA